MTRARALLKSYLELLNRAIESKLLSGSDRAFMDATAQMLSGRPVSVTIYDGDPQLLLASYTVRFSGVSAYIVGPEQSADSITLPLPYSFLEDVVEHPERYLPYRIFREWDALVSRVGSEARGKWN